MRKKIAKLLIRHADYELKNIPRYSKGDIIFLHIGKCAGTQIAQIARQIAERAEQVKIVKMNHDVYLTDLKKIPQYFFSIRDPLSRFRSGFYSRKRKGAPRIYSEWSDHEAVAFHDFEHANDLAESLFEEGELGKKAFAAIKSIRHTSQDLTDWFCQRGNFLELYPPIWIIRQEHFKDDLSVFLDRSQVGLTTDDILISPDHNSAHSNDYRGLPILSAKAKRKLKIWYAQDVEFYRICEQWMSGQREINLSDDKASAL